MSSSQQNNLRTPEGVRPSVFLKAALDDLAACERDDRFEVNMGVWHVGSLVNPCQVCLGGAYLAQSRNVGPTEMLPARADVPHNPDFRARYGWETSCQLVALDQFQRGEVRSGLDELGIHGTWHLSYRHLDRVTPHYRNNRQEWWDAMNQIVADLEELDL